MLELDLKDPSAPVTGQGRVADSPVTSRGVAREYGILVVDDEDYVRDVLDVGLRQRGFAVWLAASGREAIDAYGCHRQDIDVVLMDVRMPRVDGPRTLAALQELNPKIRCCFMTGDLGSYTEEGLRGLGAATVLTKPFRLAEVAQLLREVASNAEGRLSSP